MNLTSLQFRDQSGTRLDLSTIESRDVISSAELCHVVDVGEGVWCRPCQCTECTHAARVERALAAAGLGTGVCTVQELPQIAHLSRYDAMGETIAGCWFENGARLRYHEQADGHVSQVVFAPDNPRKPVVTTSQPEAESAERRLVTALADYSDYRRNGDCDGFQQEYPEVALIVNDVEND